MIWHLNQIEFNPLLSPGFGQPTKKIVTTNTGQHIKSRTSSKCSHTNNFFHVSINLVNQNSALLGLIPLESIPIHITWVYAKNN